MSHGLPMGSLQAVINAIHDNREVLGYDLCELTHYDASDRNVETFIGRSGGAGVIVDQKGKLLGIYDTAGVRHAPPVPNGTPSHG